MGQRPTVFTHGFGVVAAYGNKVTTDGRPSVLPVGHSVQGRARHVRAARLLWDERAPATPSWAPPRAPTPWELDYPDDDAGGQVNTTYTGDGGPSIGNIVCQG